MKRSVLKIGILAFGFFGSFFVNIAESKAETCRFLYVTENPLFAVYDCEGTLITVMRGATVES